MDFHILLTLDQWTNATLKLKLDRYQMVLDFMKRAREKEGDWFEHFFFESLFRIYFLLCYHKKTSFLSQKYWPSESSSSSSCSSLNLITFRFHFSVHIHALYRTTATKSISFSNKNIISRHFPTISINSLFFLIDSTFPMIG